MSSAVQETARAGVSHFILSGWPTLPEMIRFGDEVLPLIREGVERDFHSQTPPTLVEQYRPMVMALPAAAARGNVVLTVNTELTSPGQQQTAAAAGGKTTSPSARPRWISAARGSGASGSAGGGGSSRRRTSAIRGEGCSAPPDSSLARQESQSPRVGSERQT